MNADYFSYALFAFYIFNDEEAKICKTETKFTTRVYSFQSLKAFSPRLRSPSGNNFINPHPKMDSARSMEMVEDVDEESGA